MALTLVMQDLEKTMTPFNTKMAEIERKKRHSDATKKGQESWNVYRDLWLERLKEYPDAFPTYNQKISHIAAMWRICKISIAQRQKEKLEKKAKEKMLSLKGMNGFNKTNA